MKKNCEICSNEFETKNKTSTCSEVCNKKRYNLSVVNRRKLLKNNLPAKIKQCENCNKDIIVKSIATKFCSSKCQVEYKKKNYKKASEKELKCEICNASFIVYNKAAYIQQVCSDLCNKEFKIIHKKENDNLIIRNCEHCNDEFEVSKLFKKVCSEYCRIQRSINLQLEDNEIKKQERNHSYDEKACKCCQCTFIPKNNTQAFCTSECKDKFINVEAITKSKEKYKQNRESILENNKEDYKKNREKILAAKKENRKIIKEANNNFYEQQRIEKENKIKKRENEKLINQQIKRENQIVLAIETSRLSQEYREKFISKTRLENYDNLLKSLTHEEFVFYSNKADIKIKSQNDDKLKARRKYYADNKSDIIKNNNNYQNKRMKEDPEFKMRKNISAQIRLAIRESSEVLSSNFNLLGYSKKELKIHLESLFESWMNWNNHSTYKNGGARVWHIEHIIGQSKFKFINDDGTINKEAVQKCWSLRNLRPLDALDNIKKGGKIVDEALIVAKELGVTEKDLINNEAAIELYIIKKDDNE